MTRSLLLVLTFALSGCPKPAPPPQPPAPAVCTPISENNKASDHCSVDEADCERTLSKLLSDSHSNRCEIPPCTGFSASVDCATLSQDCQLGNGSIGMLFATEETITCR